MSGFNGEDYEFAQGSIKGLRSWGMDPLGRLHGVTHAEVWRPGENVSTCKKTRSVPCLGRINRNIGDNPPRAITGVVTWGDLDPLRRTSRPCGKHPTCDGYAHQESSGHAFDPECECGFWAYDEHAYKAHGDVTGVIEGYGKTTIGTRGFRCEKARIVALCRERLDDKVLSLSAWLRLQQLYPDAQFFEDWDEMVTKHGGVLKSWEVPGEDFWTKSVAGRDDDLTSRLLAQMLATSRARRFGGIV